MKILYVSAEVVPFARTGGLGDVAGALPKTLTARGHEVRVVMPRYGSIDIEKNNLRLIRADIMVYFPDRTAAVKIYEGRLPGSNIKIYFVDNPEMFDRPGFYGEDGKDYEDNPVRFACFNMSVLWMLKGLGWRPDIIHCNDWQSALTPIFLRNLPPVRDDAFFQPCRTLLTIHNLAYQCVFPPEMIAYIGLSMSLFNINGLEFYGKANLLKGGIYFSDHLSTVSKQYAKEIQSEEFGCGLQGLLGTRAETMTGILNGVDYSVWDPATDKQIPQNYSVDDLSGKALCKADLQKAIGLPEDPRIPLVGLISRLDRQKGIDVFIEAVPELVKTGAQFVILGNGSALDMALVREVAKKYPEQISAHLRFDNKLAHAIEAGADAFLMASRYEPCGLNQMYSLKYGTIPIVSRTGGLVDTVKAATPKTIEAGSGTGFLFTAGDARALARTVAQALKIFQNEPETWRKMQVNGMQKDFSWDHAAKEYERLFEKMKSGEAV